jgi:PTS system galactitol-specific IIA component
MVKKEIMYQTNFQTKEELFQGVTKFLVDKDWATMEFEAALREREERFPTGLPSDPPVAIPHSDGTYAKEDVIVGILNEQPLEFYQMGTNKTTLLTPRIIFVLLVRDKVTHLDQLQRIIEKAKNHEFLTRLQATSDEVQFKAMIQEEL